MVSMILTHAITFFRFLPAVLVIAGGLLAHVPQAMAAEEFATVRMRPQSMPFVTPTGKTVKRIVNLFLTVTRSARREVCANGAEVKSIFFVNTYNRQLADAKWRFDMKNLATDLYGAFEPLFGKEKLVAVHLSLGRTESSGGADNKVQKRLEQLEDCVSVRKLPQDAVTARYSDTKTGPVRSLASDADKATGQTGGGSTTAFDAPDQPFETHPQMREEQKEKDAQMADAAKAPPRPKGKPGECNVDIADLWQPIWVTVDKERLHIVHAVTVDADANGKVDDVSFVMKREDETEFKTTYLAIHGKPGGADIRGLTLAEPMMIFQLCAGSHEFPAPRAVMQAPSETALPNLAAEVASRIKGEPLPTAEKPDAVDFWRWVAAIVSITAVLLAAAVLLVFYLMMRSDRRRKHERRRKKRRKGDRRRREDGPKGDERRKGEDRRGDEDRREDAPRRKKADRRGTASEED